MAFFVFLFLAICRLGESLGKSPVVGNKEDESRISMAINPHGPLTLQEPESYRGQLQRGIYMRLAAQVPSFVDAGGHRVVREINDMPTISVYKDTSCTDLSFSAYLPVGVDWTHEKEDCQEAKLNTTASLAETGAPSHPAASSMLQQQNDPSGSSNTMAPTPIYLGKLPLIQLKLTCDDGGAIMIYSETDDGCLEHTSRYVMEGADTASKARAGSCLTATQNKKHETETPQVGVMFRTIDEVTVFPACFEPASVLGLPLPSVLTDLFGNTTSIIIISCVGGMFLILGLWIVYKFTRSPKKQPLQGEWGGEGYGQHQEYGAQPW